LLNNKLNSIQIPNGEATAVIAAKATIVAAGIQRFCGRFLAIIANALVAAALVPICSKSLFILFCFITRSGRPALASVPDTMGYIAYTS
jgi:hypothetical protein